MVHHFLAAAKKDQAQVRDRGKKYLAPVSQMVVLERAALLRSVGHQQEWEVWMGRMVSEVAGRSQTAYEKSWRGVRAAAPSWAFVTVQIAAGATVLAAETVAALGCVAAIRCTAEENPVGPSGIAVAAGAVAAAAAVGVAVVDAAVGVVAVDVAVAAGDEGAEVGAAVLVARMELTDTQFVDAAAMAGEVGPRTVGAYLG